MTNPFDYISHGADPVAYACVVLLFFLFLAGLALFVHNVPAAPMNILGAQYVGKRYMLLQSPDGGNVTFVPVILSRIQNRCFLFRDVISPLLEEKGGNEKDVGSRSRRTNSGGKTKGSKGNSGKAKNKK